MESNEVGLGGFLLQRLGHDAPRKLNYASDSSLSSMLDTVETLLPLGSV